MADFSLDLSLDSVSSLIPCPHGGGWGDGGGRPFGICSGGLAPSLFLGRHCGGQKKKVVSYVGPPRSGDSPLCFPFSRPVAYWNLGESVLPFSFPASRHGGGCGDECVELLNPLRFGTCVQSSSADVLRFGPAASSTNAETRCEASSKSTTQSSTSYAQVRKTDR